MRHLFLQKHCLKNVNNTPPNSKLKTLVSRCMLISSFKVNKSCSLTIQTALYNWQGLLGEYYNIAPGTRPNLGSMAVSPKEVRCLSKTYDDRNQQNFGLRATGFFYPRETGIYQIYLHCQDRCELYCIINGTEVKVAEQ